MSRLTILRRLVPMLLLLGLAGGGLYWSGWGKPRRELPQDPTTTVALAEPEASREEVERTCTGCHPYPPADVFPREKWTHEVERGFGFLKKSNLTVEAAPFASVVAYYKHHSPEKLPPIAEKDATTPSKIAFQARSYRLGSDTRLPGVANVKAAVLSDPRRPDVLVADMMNGLILRLKPGAGEDGLEILSEDVSNPGHLEVVDLDRDGVLDLLVANLGSRIPTEQRLGSVVWLRGKPGGGYTPITLADELGRVADVRPADFDGDGDLDLIAAVFGRLSIGEILLLENRSTKERPQFVPRSLDPRRGTIHVPVVDLNRDGKPDFIALISQEHECVVAFLNQGNLTFKQETIYAAPHPAFGSSGIEPIDMDGDGDLDVLYTNGDTLDADLLRPYHGIQWLENESKYPFTTHRLASMYGVHRALAADLDRDGDLDIVASSFMPGPYYRAEQDKQPIPSLLLLEQTALRQFARHTLETSHADHATLDLADLNNDQIPDLITAQFHLPDPQSPSTQSHPWITIHQTKP